MSLWVIGRRGFQNRARQALLAEASVLVLLLLLSSPVFAGAPESFTDVDSTNPYFEAIEGMYAAGIIDGYTVGSTREFRPDDTVKRAQFAKMIVNTLELPVSEADVCPFGDVEKSGDGNLYPDNYIAVAAANGITNGIRPGEFGPYEPIKRAQVVTMIIRAAQNIRPGTLFDAPAGYPSRWGEFDATHAPMVKVSAYNGLFDSMQSGFFSDPWPQATRGEVAQMLWNLKTFQRQVKPVDQMITGEAVPVGEAPPGLVQALMKMNPVDPNQQVDWIRRIHMEHPANASLQRTFYIAQGFDYFWAFEGADGSWMISPLAADFFTETDFSRTFAWYSFAPSPSARSGVLVWELGPPYSHMGTETPAQYQQRIDPLLAAFVSAHGEGGRPYLWYAGLRDLLRASQSVQVFLPIPGEDYRDLRWEYTRAYGQGAAIERLADVLWGWQE